MNPARGPEEGEKTQVSTSVRRGNLLGIQKCRPIFQFAFESRIQKVFIGVVECRTKK